jgi:hypothetical protein
MGRGRGNEEGEGKQMLSLKYFFHDILRSVLLPRQLYLDMHQGRSTPSWLLVVVYGGIYTAYSILAYLAGRTPGSEPWLRISPDEYYLAQAALIGPLVLFMWFQAAAMMHVLGRLSGGKGSFDRTLAMTGYSLWVPWTLLLPFNLLLGPGLLYDLALAGCMFLMLAGTSIATEIEEGIEWGYAFFFSLVAILAVAVMLFALVR